MLIKKRKYQVRENIQHGYGWMLPITFWLPAILKKPHWQSFLEASVTFQPCPRFMRLQGMIAAIEW